MYNGTRTVKEFCPKADRCKYGDNCPHRGTFRGEYLCFDSGFINTYEYQLQAVKEHAAKGGDKNGIRKKSRSK